MAPSIRFLQGAIRPSLPRAPRTTVLAPCLPSCRPAELKPAQDAYPLPSRVRSIRSLAHVSWSWPTLVRHVDLVNLRHLPCTLRPPVTNQIQVINKPREWGHELDNSASPICERRLLAPKPHANQDLETASLGHGRSVRQRKSRRRRYCCRDCAGHLHRGLDSSRSGRTGS